MGELVGSLDVEAGGSFGGVETVCEGGGVVGGDGGEGEEGIGGGYGLLAWDSDAGFGSFMAFRGRRIGWRDIESVVVVDSRGRVVEWEGLGVGHSFVAIKAEGVKGGSMVVEEVACAGFVWWLLSRGLCLVVCRLFELFSVVFTFNTR